MIIFRKPVLIALACFFAASSAFSADQQNVPILFPKDRTIVGNKVNLVLDPTDIRYFQVIVNKTEYPVVDTSYGAHAYQGLALDSGENTITVNVLDEVANDKKGKDAQKKFNLLGSRTVTVFNRDGAFSPVPPGFTSDPFHTREREASCSSCHRLEVKEQDLKHEKRDDVLCYVCHRQIPVGKYVHGPAAVWSCFSCHDPELYPAKYAFASVDPWKLVKTTQSVEPILFTIPTVQLFQPDSAVLISKPKAAELLAEVTAYLKQNPTDRVRLEVHSDNSPVKLHKTKKGKVWGFRSNKALTAARARALTVVMKQSGILWKRIVAVGMGDQLPKAQNSTPAGREQNNRVEIVVYPGDVRVINSQKLPVLKDRERVVVNLSYKTGPHISKLRMFEQMPKGFQYIKGSAFLRGRPAAPKMSGGQMVWDLGAADANFSETVSYVVKKGKSGVVAPGVRISYTSGRGAVSRDLDPKKIEQGGLTIEAACFKCHSDVLNGTYKHGPVAAGYCSLCHDPHASPNPAWLRKPVWELCSTCHPDQGSGVHVVAGFATGITHPTRGRRDPARPGKHLSCASCHAAHSAGTPYLLGYDARTRSELCAICHYKK